MRETGSFSFPYYILSQYTITQKLLHLCNSSFILSQMYHQASLFSLFRTTILFQSVNFYSKDIWLSHATRLYKQRSQGFVVCLRVPTVWCPGFQIVVHRTLRISTCMYRESCGGENRSLRVQPPGSSYLHQTQKQSFNLFYIWAFVKHFIWKIKSVWS